MTPSKAALLALVALACTVAAWMVIERSLEQRRQLYFTHLKQELESRLPVGSPLQDIELVLSDLSVGFQHQEKANAVYGMAPQTNPNPLASDVITVVAQLDQDKQLVSLTVRRVFT